MTVFFAIITGVVSGLISSIIIFVFWQLQKPKIEISKVISRNSNGEFRVKIVNKTRHYVSDISVQLQVVRRTNGHNGYVNNIYNLDMPYSEILFINPRKDVKKSTDHAIRFVLPADLETHWTDDKEISLKLIVHCFNEFKTASKTFEQCYYRKECIKDGEFVCGDSMEII